MTPTPFIISSELMCEAVGVRRAQRRPGRPVKREQHAKVEDQSDFGF